MHFFYLYLFYLILTFNSHAQDFEKDAKALAQDLKSSLMKNLMESLASEGPIKAISFCHLNVKPIAKAAAAEKINKFEFGRTSHKLRNEQNKMADWAEPYLKDFQGKKKSEMKKDFIIHQMPNGKKVYLEPLYVQAQCLICHGSSVDQEVKNKINELYPKDLATGFELDEFRGFIWIKEK
jgi:hypothetical protein